MVIVLSTKISFKTLLEKLLRKKQRKTKVPKIKLMKSLIVLRKKEKRKMQLIKLRL